MSASLKNWLKRSAGQPYSITIEMDPSHIMVILRLALDWILLVKIVEKHRNAQIKNAAGRKPSPRILTGVVIVRILKSCTLREAFELVKYHAPSRYLCGLENSDWTPNFRTISDFEILLGSEGLREINNYVLNIAAALGFADIRGLCSDTTAQEAQIPHPTEVGLMGSFAKSVEAAVETLKGKAGKAKNAIMDGVEKIKKLVRKNRLFCKTTDAKRKVEKALLTQTKKTCRSIQKMVEQIGKSTVNRLRGHQKTAFSRLSRLTKTFGKLAPQISYYIQNKGVAKDKIVSLFLEIVRSIPRGKAGKTTEFGLKWGINQLRGGYISLFQVEGRKSEQDCAVQAVVHHMELFGEAPKEFGYDRGGWSEPHFEKMKKLGVKVIGIAPKGKAKWKIAGKCKERIVRERAQVEGKIGTIKGYSFNRPDAKTTAGMVRSAHRAEIRFNLTKLVKDLGKM